MKTIIDNPVTHSNSKTIIGVVILIIGGLLLINQFSFFIIPGWLFSWPMILIAAGIISGARHNFSNRGWLVMVVIGLLFLLDNAIPILFISHLIWPVAIIALGLYLIMRPGYGLRNWRNRF